MAKIKLNFRQLSIPEKIARARQILAAMTGNPHFPHPLPDLDDLRVNINELEGRLTAAQAARLEAKHRTAELAQGEDNVDGLVSQLVAYVESVAGDDESVIYSAGLEVRGPNTPASSASDAPASMATTAGDHDGEIELSWDAVRNARSYVIERSLDPPTETSWAHAAVSTRSSTTIQGLNSGTRYWFRVAAVTASGQSPWSNPATKIAP
ncbi:MAG TPA: fibronectin type III domain-containing protein [Pyrinomonadaceae bacterium]|nr:fibronectin type III domain-containing protein [Pyrinomonadaceae bacterium]